MSRVRFTREIVENAERLVEQLHLALDEMEAISKPVVRLQQQVASLFKTITVTTEIAESLNIYDYIGL